MSRKKLPTSSKRLKKLGLGMRLLDYLIDLPAIALTSVILLPIWSIITLPINFTPEDEAIAMYWTFGLIIIAIFTYYMVLEGFFGRSLAKLITRSRVISIEFDAQPVDPELDENNGLQNVI